MKNSVVQFGFIGAGEISHHSANNVKNHPQARLAAAQDLSQPRLAELCAKHQIPKAYATAEELFADPEIDVVYIAVPNKFHVPLSIQAMKAGKHVILDKPFAMNLAEAEKATAVSRETGKILNLGMNQRFEMGSQKARAMIERGDFGDIYHAKAYWLRRAGIPKLGTWFGNKDLAGAGCLYDIGVHFLDLALFLLGDFHPVSVSGATYTKFGHLGLGGGGWGKSDKANLPFNVEDFATGFIRFSSGMTLALDVSWACHAEEGSREDVQLYGSKMGAMVRSRKRFYRNEETGEHVVAQEFPAMDVRYPHCDRFHNFINHLLGKEELCVTLDQAVAVQKILDAIAVSASTGKEVRLQG